ncbi:MAG: hypothetical protein VXX63_00725 [Bacteroidota bacterium]|nr:hypothetical protein [Bacteroidota bacterium]
MKNKIIILSIVSLFATTFISSCGPDEEPQAKITVDFVGGSAFVSSDATLTTDSEFSVGINATGEKKITKVSVSQSVNGAAAGVVLDTATNETNVRVIYQGRTTNSAGSMVITFQVTDKDNNVESKSLTITVSEAGQNLTLFDKDVTDKTLKVWNADGPNAGAFDLVVGVQRLKDDDDAQKDIKDLGLKGSSLSWSPSWTTGNGTKFKKLNDWNNIKTDIALKEAYDAAGGETDQIENIAEGDVYGLKLRGGDTYALVLITKISDVTNNEDHIEFQFKKVL